MQTLLLLPTAAIAKFVIFCFCGNTGHTFKANYSFSDQACSRPMEEGKSLTCIVHLPAKTFHCFLAAQQKIYFAQQKPVQRF